MLRAIKKNYILNVMNTKLYNLILFGRILSQRGTNNLFFINSDSEQVNKYVLILCLFSNIFFKQ